MCEWSHLLVIQYTVFSSETIGRHTVNKNRLFYLYIGAYMYIYEKGLVTEIDTIDFWVMKLWEDLWGEKLEKVLERKGKRESDVILFKLKMYKILNI